MLNGATPQSIKLMAQLMELYLNFNSLGGGIPKEVGGLKKLDVFDLSHNAFTGPIPKEVGKMKSLDILNLSFNQLTGFISGDLGKLKALSEYFVAFFCYWLRSPFFLTTNNSSTYRAHGLEKQSVGGDCSA